MAAGRAHSLKETFATAARAGLPMARASLIFQTGAGGREFTYEFWPLARSGLSPPVRRGLQTLPGRRTAKASLTWRLYRGAGLDSCHAIQTCGRTLGRSRGGSYRFALDVRWDWRARAGDEPLFVVSLTGAPRQISRDPYQHTFYVGEADLAGRAMAVRSSLRRSRGMDGRFLTATRSTLSPADGGEPQQLTALKGYGQQARPAPDGSGLAFVGYDWKGQTYHVGKLRLQGGSADPVREVTTAWDRDVASPLWAADSKRIYFLSDDHGDINLYESDLTGTTRQVSQGHQRVTSLSIAGNRAAFIYSTPTEPPRLATFSLESPEKVAVLVDPNRDLMSGCALSKAEEIRYESFDGLKIQAWLLKPPGFSPTRKYPLLVSIHGGPHGSYGNSFNQELQAFADHGYVVLYVNPRGSTGYGEAFGNIIQHKWPGDDIKDVMAGADYTLKQGFTDPEADGGDRW